jgi:hypothetical protein
LQRTRYRVSQAALLLKTRKPPTSLQGDDSQAEAKYSNHLSSSRKGQNHDIPFDRQPKLPHSLTGRQIFKYLLFLLLGIEHSKLILRK